MVILLQKSNNLFLQKWLQSNSNAILAKQSCALSFSTLKPLLMVTLHHMINVIKNLYSSATKS